MIVLYHRGKDSVYGLEPCNGPALGITESWDIWRDKSLPAAIVVKLDGTKPKQGEFMVCASCKEMITPHHLSDQ